MATDAITDLFPQVMSAASNIQMWGSMWYQASTDFIEFKKDLRRLRRLQDLWFEESRKYGGLLDEGFADTLNEAASLLKSTASLLLSEVERLKSKEEAKGTFCACLTDCWGMLCVLTFPTPVKARIKLVADTFEEISGSLQSDQDIRIALERRMLSRTYSSAFTFSSDDRYVSFEDSEFEVHSALKNPKAVILLHGGPGQGKSTLARHVALHYNNQRKNAQEGMNGTTLFDRVVYLECGPEVETSPKQLELLQQLGLNTTLVQELGQSTTDHDPKLSNLLRGVLKEKKVLVVLDDVWSVEFLQQMIDPCGSLVKCLVTSQRGDLCWRLNCSAPEVISIQDIPRTVARKILASHVGFRNQQIPDGLIMDEAEKIIQETRGNPLALASVAAAISRNRAYDVTEWRNASKRFLQLLKTEDTALIQSRKYPRSFWSAMQFSVESLTKEAKKLLTLVHLCEGPSIPLEIIEYLHQTIDVEGSLVPFQALTNELESRELLKISSKMVDSSNDETEHSLSTHSLQKLFMEEEKNMRDLKNLMLVSLNGLLNLVGSEISMQTDNTTPSTGEEAVVRLAFCALYLDKQFAKKAASKIGIPYDKCTNLRRNAIEPVARLLVQLNNDSGGTTTMRNSARQIFLRYTCDGILHHDGIKHLFASAISIRPMLQALTNISLVATRTPMEIRPGGWLQELINFLSKDGNPQLQKMAALTLTYLARQNLEAASTIIDSHRTVEHLSNLLSTNEDPGLQDAAVWALIDLTSMGGLDSQNKVANFPGMLEKLVDLLSMDSNPHLQESAVIALGSIGQGGKEAQSKILDSNGVLEHLLDLLSRDKHLDLQLAALGTLTSLNWGDLDSRKKVANFPGMLEKLVDLLLMDSNPRLQEKALKTLSNLALGGEEAQSKILDSNGVLEHLSDLLARDKDLDLQLAAVMTLTNLAFGEGALEYSRKKVANFPGMLEKLVDLLLMDSNPRLQENALNTLSNLALGGEEAQSKILDSNGVLEHLSDFLSRDKDLDLQLAALGTLTNLTCREGDLDSKNKVANFPGMLEKLVDLLSMDSNPRLQEWAVIALGNIGRGEEAPSKILDSNGVLEHLSDLLARDKDLDLQLSALRTLTNLTREGDLDSKNKITNFPGMLEKLVDLLSMDSNPRLQESVVKTLRNLALGGGEAASKTLYTDGLLEHLSNSLEGDKDPAVQMAALWTLLKPHEL